MNIEAKVCPVCGEGELVEYQHEHSTDIDGYGFVVRGLRHSLCTQCHERVVTPEQSRHNKRTMIEARARAVAERDRAQRLTPADIVRIRKKLGLTQTQAARVFGGGINAFSKYENNEVEPSDGMEKLLRMADSVPEAATWLLRRGGATHAPALSLGREGWQTLYATFERLAKELAIHRRDIENAQAGVFSSLMSASAFARTMQFTYASKDAANDPRLPSRPELLKVG